MKKQTIAVDIDDVLSSQNDAMRLFINGMYGLNLTAKDYDIEAPYWGYWEKVWQVDEREAKKRYEAFHEANSLLYQTVSPEVIESLWALQKNYRLVIVTARHDKFKDITHKWLDQHFPKVFEQVEFVDVWDKLKPKTKAEICKATGADYLIDDNPEHCISAAKEEITALLFGDYGWNRNIHLPKGVTRVKDWPAIMEFFNVIR